VTARATLKARAIARGEITLCDSRGSATGNGKRRGKRNFFPSRGIHPSGRNSLVRFAKLARRVLVQSTHGPRIVAQSFCSTPVSCYACRLRGLISCSCSVVHSANAIFVVMCAAGLRRGLSFLSGRMVLGMCRSRGGLSCNSFCCTHCERCVRRDVLYSV